MLLVGVQTSEAIVETSMEGLDKLKLALPSDPAMPLLGITSRTLHPTIETCTSMFAAALLATASKWRQHRCPSADDGHGKMCRIHDWVLFSLQEKKEILKYSRKQVNLGS